MSTPNNRHFQPEDFDTPQKNSNTKRLGWAVGICAVLALAGIGGYALLAPKTLETTDEVAATSSVKDASDKESAYSEDIASEDVANEVNVSSSEMDDSEHKTEDGQVATAGNQQAATSTEPSLTVNPTASQEDEESINREAMKVIRGDYGDGKVRMNKLGVNYNRIQSRVN